MNTSIPITEVFENSLEKFGELAIESHGKERIMKEVVTREFSIPGISILSVRNALYVVGSILEEDLPNNTYTATIDTGFMKAVKALAVIRLNGTAVECAAYATEGLIRQNCAKKAIDSIENALKNYNS